MRSLESVPAAGADPVADPVADLVLAVVGGDWGAADMVLEMVSVAKEQSATGLSLLMRYLSCICVAVLARMLTRPVSICVGVCMLNMVGILSNLNPCTCHA